MVQASRIVLLLCVALVACGQRREAPEYAKASVQPVVVDRLSDTQLRIRYAVPPATMLYSPGVDYSTRGGTLRIVIDRCRLEERCEPMAKAPLPGAKPSQAEVLVPYRGERVVMVYSDLEEQVYP